MADIAPLLVQCPNCAAPVGKPCTIPTERTRQPVRWFHASREDAARKKAEDETLEYLVDVASPGGQGEVDFFEKKEEAEAYAQRNRGTLYEIRKIGEYK